MRRDGQLDEVEAVELKMIKHLQNFLPNITELLDIENKHKRRWQKTPILLRTWRSFIGTGNILFPKQSGEYKGTCLTIYSLVLSMYMTYSCVSVPYFIIKHLNIMNAMHFKWLLYLRILRYSCLVIAGMLYKFFSLTLKSGQ